MAAHYKTPRCQVLPLPDSQMSFQIDGVERLRWHFGRQYPRPFFYPLAGPGGSSLTRMGHPGDFTHEHHRSIWFAHHDVAKADFWSEGKRTAVRQKEWLDYLDSDAEAALAVRLAWIDDHDAELLEQELIVSVQPGPGPGETLVELQSRFTPAGASLTFNQTNFGFLAVRVAKNLSEHFGGGRLTNSEGKTGEQDLFGNPARWMDYSGPVPGGPAPGRPAGDGSRAADRIEGITYFDHRTNPDYPARWHVRADGWMGASACRTRAIEITPAKPLELRYLLYAHAGALDANRAEMVGHEFEKAFPLTVERVKIPNQRYRIERKSR